MLLRRERSRWLTEGLFHQGPGTASQVAFSYEDAAPPQGGQQSLGAGVVGPELRKMGTGLDRASFERRQEAVGVAAVALLGQHHHVNQVGGPCPEPVPQAANPIADLVAEDQVTFIKRAGPAGRVLFLLEDLGKPGR